MSKEFLKIKGRKTMDKIAKTIAEELNIHHNNIDAGVNILNPNVGQI